MKIAIIDCGTNTFKLLIVHISNNKWYKTYLSVLPVKLTENQVDSIISPERMARGIDVLKNFQENIVNFGAKKTYAFATSAIRSAKNGKEYLKLIKQETKIKIQIIDGNREAELIYKGVSQSVEMKDEAILIMDIGGGSTEFIIGNNTGILWRQSFKLGSSRLNNMFKPSAPILNDEVKELEGHFTETLPVLFEQIKIHQPTTIIGNSGAFHSLVSLINHNYNKHSLLEVNNEIPLDLFFEVHEKLSQKTLEEKLNILGLEPMRAEIIVLATLLTKFVLEKSQINKLVQTPFALKEGAVKEVMEQ